MKVLMIRPCQNPIVEEIGSELNELQKAVGGYIQAVYPWNDQVALVCNEDGKLDGSEPNRPLFDEKGELYDVVYGTFFICGLGEENFADIPDNLVDKYTKMFEKNMIIF